MSVVSERSGRRPAPRHKPRPLGGRGRGYSQSDIESPFIVPRFSAIASEGVKRTMYDDWGENTTCVTGNTSEHSYLGEEPKIYEIPAGRLMVRRCSRMMWVLVASVLTTLALFSAPLMITMPFIVQYFGVKWPVIECGVDCQGNIIELGVKSFLLLFALWAMYWRRAAADLPRLFFNRAAIAVLVLFELFAFWLFYTVRILIEKQPKYFMITEFALSLTDALLYTHYVSVIVLELRKHRPEFIVTIVRDPDGESKTLMIGKMSLQEASIEVLRFYNTTFPSYNAQLDRSRYSNTRSRSSVGNLTGFKMYDIEGLGGHDPISGANARVLMEAASRRRITGHDDLMQKEQEWMGRYQKRLCRLQTAAEDGFGQVQIMQNSLNTTKQYFGEPMDSRAAAETVYSWVSRPLSKFLRLTRQTTRHTPESIKEHIEKCLAMKVSSRTFTQKYTSDRLPDKLQVAESKWSLISAEQASMAVDHGSFFVLRCHEQSDDLGVQLLCSISSLPFYNLTEQSRPSHNKYTLKISADPGV